MSVYTAVHVGLLLLFIVASLGSAAAMVAVSRGLAPARPVSLAAALCSAYCLIIELTVIREPFGTTVIGFCLAYNLVIATRPSLYRRGR